MRKNFKVKLLFMVFTLAGQMVFAGGSNCGAQDPVGLNDSRGQRNTQTRGIRAGNSVAPTHLSRANAEPPKQ